jgi:hypothetical protein
LRFRASIPAIPSAGGDITLRDDEARVKSADFLHEEFSRRHRPSA